MSGFDRIKPPERKPHAAAEDARVGGPEIDPAGRAALFSAGAAQACAGGCFGLALACGACGTSTPLDARAALRAAFPLFLVAPWRQHQVFAVCPACRRRTWLRLGAAEDAGP